MQKAKQKQNPAEINNERGETIIICWPGHLHDTVIYGAVNESETQGLQPRGMEYNAAGDKDSKGVYDCRQSYNCRQRTWTNQMRIKIDTTINQ